MLGQRDEPLYSSYTDKRDASRVSYSPDHRFLTCNSSSLAALDQSSSFRPPDQRAFAGGRRLVDLVVLASITSRHVVRPIRQGKDRSVIVDVLVPALFGVFSLNAIPLDVCFRNATALGGDQSRIVFQRDTRSTYLATRPLDPRSNPPVSNSPSPPGVPISIRAA